MHHKHGVNIVYENLTNIYEYRKFVDANQLCVLHVMKSGCSVCYAVLPQLDDLIQQFPRVKLGVINQNKVEDITRQLSIFTVPVDLIFFRGKEVHRQARFIDMQRFERQLIELNDNIEYK